MTAVAAPYRISGHEGFPCRYTWLPKVVRGLEDSKGKLFSDEDQAMVDLGLGKNMVRSARFWGLAAGIIQPISRTEGYKPTRLGSAILSRNGLDPFLEDIRTLWLIHWHLSTNRETPLLAWDFLINRWQAPELIPSLVIEALRKQLTKDGVELSLATIEQHFETFLHTYVPTRGRKGEVLEDNLDCPLVELEVVIKTGERPGDGAGARGESIYAFRREQKPEINQDLFLYCLNNYCRSHHLGEKTVPLRSVAHGHGSPGQVFKLQEDDIADRLGQLAQQTEGAFAYSPSADMQQVYLNQEISEMELLDRVYATEVAV